MANPAVKPRSTTRIDIATIAGLVLGVGGIVGWLILEGGHIQEIMAPTALMIVLGGTVGAVMIMTPLSVLRGGMKALGKVFLERAESSGDMIDQIVQYSSLARKSGIVALEDAAGQVEDPFLRKALNLAMDGTDLQELRRMMELEIEMEERSSESEVKIFEGAGGYAPTIGIIGAVLGLIQVMKDLADIEKVGHGIATAFVATIYGVAFANLFFLPAAGKIKARAQQKAQIRELMLEGVIGIVEGLNQERRYVEKSWKAGWGMSSRRKKAPEPVNHERWLISYADFITLLFAFFVVMFASSQTDRSKSQEISDAFNEAIGKDKVTSAIAGILGGAPGLKQEGNAQKKGPGGQHKLTALKAAAAAAK